MLIAWFILFFFFTETSAKLTHLISLVFFLHYWWPCQRFADLDMLGCTHTLHVRMVLLQNTYAHKYYFNAFIKIRFRKMQCVESWKGRSKNDIKSRNYKLMPRNLPLIYIKVYTNVWLLYFNKKNIALKNITIFNIQTVSTELPIIHSVDEIHINFYNKVIILYHVNRNLRVIGLIIS